MSKEAETVSLANIFQTFDSAHNRRDDKLSKSFVGGALFVSRRHARRSSPPCGGLRLCAAPWSCGYSGFLAHPKSSSVFIVPKVARSIDLKDSGKLKMLDQETKTLKKIHGFNNKKNVLGFFGRKRGACASASALSTSTRKMCFSMVVLHCSSTKHQTRKKHLQT